MTHAAAAPNGWFVLGAWSGDLELYWLRDEHWRYLTGLPLEQIDPTYYHLGSVDQKAILTLGAPPFDILVVDTAGKVLFYRADEERTARPGTAPPGPPIRAFPALLVGDRVVQVVASLREDKYRIDVYDSAGHTLRSTALPGPLTLVANVTGRNELIGFTNLMGLSELSVYSWQWRGVPASTADAGGS